MDQIFTGALADLLAKQYAASLVKGDDGSYALTLLSGASRGSRTLFARLRSSRVLHWTTGLLGFVAAVLPWAERVAPAGAAAPPQTRDEERTYRRTHPDFGVPQVSELVYARGAYAVPPKASDLYGFATSNVYTFPTDPSYLAKFAETLGAEERQQLEAFVERSEPIFHTGHGDVYQTPWGYAYTDLAGAIIRVDPAAGYWSNLGPAASTDFSEDRPKTGG